MQGKNDMKLNKIKIGPTPFLDQCLKRIGLKDILRKYVNHEGYASAIEILIKSHLVEPAALYRIPSIAKLCGWTDDKISDDQIGRSLDKLFKADRSSLQTETILNAISSYEIDTSTIHNDTTSVKFFGEYTHQSSQSIQLKRGHSKDHRPDLKQLIYNLSVCSDGAIPIHFKCYDGNTTDDSIHIETWMTLRSLLKRSDFLYVADSKLCTEANMRKIDKEQGQFVTIVPKTRSEVHDFYDQCYTGDVRWKNLTWFPCPRDKGRQDVFHIADDFYQLSEGYKMFWYRSSSKAKRDQESRGQRINAAIVKLGELNQKKRRGPKTRKGLETSTNKVLNRFKVNKWISVEVKIKEEESFHQNSPGKPNADTKYIRKVKKIPYLVVKKNRSAIDFSKSHDGVFPLVTNTKMDAKQTLKTYRYQPKIEKRFSYMKSDYQVAPMFLKKTERIEALMFICFLSDMVAAMIARELQMAMKKSGIDELQILPEERATKTPTWEQIQRLFAYQFKNELTDSGALIKTFWDDLTCHQKRVIELMEIPISTYGGCPNTDEQGV